MKLIVISSNKKTYAEPRIITEMFDKGLELYHLRKQKFSRAELEEYLSLIPPHYRNRIIIHSKHRLAIKYKLRGIHLTRKHQKKKLRTWLRTKYIKSKMPEIKITASFHALDKLEDAKNGYDYVFLSPVFDSISKGSYQGKFSGGNLADFLPRLNHKVIALGGVDTDKIDQIYDMGFSGMALHGALWEDNSPVEKFVTIQQACEQKNMLLV